MLEPEGGSINCNLSGTADKDFVFLPVSRFFLGTGFIFYSRPIFSAGKDRTFMKKLTEQSLMEIAQRIREMREIVGYSPAQLAERTDVSEETYRISSPRCQEAIRNFQCH